MAALPDYIEQRIRRPVPSGAFVVAGSTPVVSFGNSRTADVASLALNPSRVEFVDRHGNELVGDDRRLATHTSLGIDDLGAAPIQCVEQVLADCDDYFGRNPYRRWFNVLEGILNGCGVSYYDGSACHLDLVQWATDPTWGQLPTRAVRRELLDADAEFLSKQLSNENIRLLLVNGARVSHELTRSLGVEWTEQVPIEGYGRYATRVHTGSLGCGTQVIAWSTNLQSSFGVSNALKSELADRVATHAAESHEQVPP